MDYWPAGAKRLRLQQQESSVMANFGSWHDNEHSQLKPML
jgi:hypothetical protein